MLFTFGVVIALSANAAPPGLFELLQAAPRVSGQLHVQLFGSTALLRQPLPFASALTVLGMEKSTVLFPCCQQVQFI